METLVVYFEGINTYLLQTPLSVLLAQLLFLWIAALSIVSIYTLLILRLSGRYHQPHSYLLESNQTILLLGDSTGTGTGSRAPELTMAGYLAKDFPHTNIINKAVNGSVTRAVLSQLEAVAPKQPFDMIVISTGGNDVWAFTGMNKLRKDLFFVLQKAKTMSDNKVVLLFFGNEGSSKFFPFFLRPIIMYRTEKIRQLFTQVAKLEKVSFIELFSNPNENPFVKDPKKYFAPDGLHPNEFGYWEWYKHLWRLMIQKNHFYQEEHIMSTSDYSIKN